MNRAEFLATSPKNEQQFTHDCFLYTNKNYPAHRKLFFHVMNEMERLPGETSSSHMMRLGKAKSMGVLPGVPDFICIAPLFCIELKMEKGKVSDAQKILHAEWDFAGVAVHVCYTPSQFIEAIESHIGKPPFE